MFIKIDHVFILAREQHVNPSNKAIVFALLIAMLAMQTSDLPVYNDFIKHR